jgi:hypothetical protein
LRPHRRIVARPDEKRARARAVREQGPHVPTPRIGYSLLCFLLLGVIVAVAVFFAFKAASRVRRSSAVARCGRARARAHRGVRAAGLIVVSVVTLPDVRCDMDR